MSSTSSIARACPALEDLGLYGTGSSTTRAEGQVDQLFVTQATPSFFTTLGARAQHGRLPNDTDDANVVVLSDWLWRSWFGADEKVIGRSYLFAGGNRIVIGITKPEFRFPDERTAFWMPFVIRAAQVTAGGFGARAVARMTPGIDSAGLTAQLQPLARRVQERLGGPAPYVRIMERHRPVVKPLREQLVGNDLDAAVDSPRHGRHRLPDRVRERRQSVHGAGGEPAPRSRGAPRARRRTRGPRALAGDRGAAARGRRRCARRAHRVGRRSIPGARGAGRGRRRLWRRTDSRTRHRGPRPHRAALHGGYLVAGGVRVRPAARARFLRHTPGQPPAVWTRHRRTPECHARCAGGACRPPPRSCCWWDRRS